MRRIGIWNLSQIQLRYASTVVNSTSMANRVSSDDQFRLIQACNLAVLQGDSVTLDIGGSSISEMWVLPTWEERLYVTSNDPAVREGDFDVHHSPGSGLYSIAYRPHLAPPLSSLRLYVPQKFNVSVLSRGQQSAAASIDGDERQGQGAGRTNVVLFDKIEGDVSVEIEEGDISVNKIRGQRIHLATNDGEVLVKSVVEGGCVLRGTRLKSKLILGSSVSAAFSHGVDIEAVYSPSVQVRAPQAISIGFLHGALEAACGGDVVVEGITGSVVLGPHREGEGAANATVKLHYDKPIGPSDICSSTTGSVAVTLSSPVVIGLDLRATHVTIDTGRLLPLPAPASAEVGVGLGVEGAIVGASCVQGQFTSVSQSPSPSTLPGRKTSGKINRDAAAAASDTSFYVNHTDGAPSLKVNLKGQDTRVTVEVLSWMDMMKRKMERKHLS